MKDFDVRNYIRAELEYLSTVRPNLKNRHHDFIRGLIEMAHKLKAIEDQDYKVFSMDVECK